MEQLGFFSDEELAAVSPPGCGNSCQLYESCRSPRMPLTGKGKKGILIVAEAPGEEEDARNVQLVGKAGQRLRKELQTFDIDLDVDCWKTNAVTCRPPDNRTPTVTEIAACRPNVVNAITTLKPRLILLLGKTAMDSVIGHSNPTMASGKNRGFTLLRGLVIPDQVLGCWVSSTYHPSYILRTEYDPSSARVWHNDITRALNQLEQPFPKLACESCIHISQKPETVECLLRNKVLSEKPWLTFDYETTGKKPFAKGHDVVSIGIAFNGHAASFPLDRTPAWNKVRELWKMVLKDGDVHKVAHNTAFDRLWSERIFNVDPTGWIGDTCLLAHLEDCRRHYTSLDVLSYVKLGAPSYKDELKAYKAASEADEKQFGANAINRMKLAPMEAKLKYNGRDALYTWLIMNHYLETGVSDGAVYG